MQGNTLEKTDQIPAVIQALQGTLGDALLAVYLHGSAVSGELRPQSDIDLLAVAGRGMTESQRNDLLTALLQISSHYPATPGGPQYIELMANGCGLASRHASCQCLQAILNTHWFLHRPVRRLALYSAHVPLSFCPRFP